VARNRVGTLTQTGAGPSSALTRPSEGGAWRHAGVRSVRISKRAWAGAAAIAFVAALGVWAPTMHVVSSLLSDSYMTLYAGRWIAQHGIPHHEVFTIAARGRAWIDQQWLAELTDYELWRTGGYAAVALVSVASIGLCYGMLAAVMIKRGTSVVLAVCCSAIAIVVALPAMFIRAQTFAFPLFALLLALCLDDAEHERPRRRLILLLPLLAVWANVHGSVLMGAGLAAAYLVYRAISMARQGARRAAWECGALAVGALLMTLATPYGFGITHYYVNLLGNHGIAAASPEWRPPAGLTLLAFVAVLALVLASLAALLIRRRRPSWLLVSATAATAVAAAIASRNDVWFAMVAVLVIADATRGLMATATPSRRFASILATVAVGLAALGIADLATHTPAQYEQLTPVHAIAAAAAYASRYPCARILGDNDAASALLWLDPSLAGRVAFDARLEQYSEPQLDRWITFQVADTKQWLNTTRGYALLIGSTKYNPSLVHRLARLPNATTLVHDSRGIAVVNTSSNGRCSN
jgi:hypothetical protein